MSQLNKSKFIKSNLSKLLFCLLILAPASKLILARDRYVHVNNFLDFDDIFKELRQQFLSFGTSKEERKLIKKARGKLSQINPTIEQKDGKVVISIPLDSIETKNIDIQVEDNILNATIPSEYGKVQMVIDNNYLELSRRIEVRKEQENANQKDVKVDQTKPVKKESTVYYGSMATTVERLPFTVDVNSAKASTKDNVLNITLDKKQHTKVNIEHLK